MTIRAVPFSAASLLVGCKGAQSALDPAGPSAASIHLLGIVMWVGAAIVTLLVTVLMLAPFVRRRSGPANRRLFLWGGGVALPTLTLTALVPYVMTIGHETRSPIAAHRISVDVTAHQFWWAVSYRAANVLSPVISANEIRLPVGEPVEVVLRTDDVIHSFWIPSLAGKTDMIPGHTNRMMIEATRAGVYRGQCAEFCGAQHALMAFDVIATDPREFDAWLARLAKPVPAPQTPELRQGRAVFVEYGCVACHSVRGVSESHLGPDLTDVGGRRSIGAGTMPGGATNIARWIVDSQHLKPGNTMPGFERLDGRRLAALGAYMASLQ